MLRSLAIVLIGIGWCISAFANPLPGEPRVMTFSMAEYKSNVQNWAVELGPDGLMYVGGGMGLLAYNGVDWTRYDTPNNSRVRNLLIDEQGRFWIGSTNHFGYFERDDTGAMHYQSISEQLPDDQQNFGEVRDLAKIGGVLYFNTLNALFRWDGTALERLASWDGVFRMMLVVNDRVLVAVRNRLHDVTTFDQAIPEPLERWRWPDGARLTFLEPWPDGRILAGTYNDGLYWLSDQPPVRFEIDFDLSAVWPYTIHRRADASFLLGTRHAGLLQFSDQGKLIEHISTQNGLPKEMINAIAEDDQGGVWLPQDGVITRIGLFEPIRSYAANAGVVSARGMTAHDGRWFLATDAGVGLLEAEATDTSQLTTLPTDVIDAWDVLSAEGELLVAGFSGVHRMRFDAEQRALIDRQQLLDDTYAYRLTRSRFREVIYAETERGLSLLVRKNDQWVSGGVVEGVTERAHHVAEASAEEVWVGTTSGRFYRLGWQGEPARLNVLSAFDEQHGVPAGYAWPFALGERLVLGTSEGGYRPQMQADGTIVGVEPDPEFNNNQLGDSRAIYKMASPDGRRVIAGIGDGGALRFGRIDTNGAFVWQPNPVPGIEFGQNDFINADDQNIWIGRQPGLVHLNWPVSAAEPAKAPLHIVRAGYPEQDHWLVHGPSDQASLSQNRLPFERSALRLDYALAGFESPSRHRYRVRLDGLDQNWSRWNSETSSSYTNLSGGRYTFRVQAMDGRGRIIEATAVQFAIAPPWFLSPLAWTLYAIAALALLLLAVRYGQFRRQRIMLSRQQALETEVAERTRQLRRQARKIREISDARASFFANVSHELRTPLTLTRAPLEELARDEQGLSAVQREHLHMALRNTESMQGLIGQVLDLHRLDADSMPFHPVRADLAAAISSIVQRFQLQAGQRQIKLKTSGLDQPVPAPFDPDHLSTMLTNLLSNALKFGPRDSMVQIELSSDDRGYSVTVSDQGPGIDPADQERIFERYQQADKSIAGGTGIGLALVRELAELHDGRVRVESVPGQGARFQFRLPEKPEIQDVPASANGEMALPAAPLPEPDETGDRARVLIVEDNAELRAFLRFRLGQSYEIHEAGDGLAGLEAARKLVPDAIVTDGMMPEMDGLTMASALKADAETDFIPILMLTARGGPDAVIRGMQAGADDYLAKPFDSAELAARIAGLIASRRRLRERMQSEPSAAQASAIDPATSNPFVQRALEVMQAHLPEPGFSVRDWAGLLHMDRTTLFRKFKAATDQSPDEALREARLELAARLLRQKAGNVAEIADAVGFASVSAFSRRFRERFKQSPAAYARNGRSA